MLDLPRLSGEPRKRPLPICLSLMHHRNSIQYHLGTRFELVMRVKPPLLRRSFVPPDEAPILRYAVAILSVDLILALIPAFLLSDVVVESRVVVFSVSIMVSAWYVGWKPGLLATAFASIVSAYFSLAGLHSSSDYRKALIHLVVFVFVARR